MKVKALLILTAAASLGLSPVAALASASAAAAPGASASPQAPLAAAPAAKRPLKVGLVLSGGGARGFAHVGVLRVLEEAGVKVDFITATSMGSMVGGGYAEGYTPDEIERIVKSVDWKVMFLPKPSRDEMNWRRKEDKNKGLSDTELGIGPAGFALPYGIISTQELDLFLSRVNEPAAKVNDLGKLPVPFAAFATDLETGKSVTLQKGVTLSQAMRASMSIPGAFAPAEWNGKLLVDGGLVQNLPVDAVRKMGADVVIAVNVGTPLSPRKELGSITGVMGQMINILTEQNVQKSISELGPNDIFIVPDLQNYTSGSFDKSDEIIRAGEAAARQVIDRLRALGVSQQEFRAWNEARTRPTKPEKPHRLAAVRVDGLKTVNPGLVEREIHFKAGDAVTTAQVQDAAKRIWQDDQFLSVPYHFEPGPDGMEVLVFEPQEKTWGYSSFRFGGRVQTNFTDDNSFSFMLQHTLGWLNEAGGELKTGLQVGENQLFEMQFYQPLGVGSPVYLNPKLSVGRQDYDIYIGDRRTDTWQNEQLTGTVELGYELGRYGKVSGGIGWQRQKNNRLIGTSSLSIPDGSTGMNFLSLDIDRLDSVSFPTNGYKLNAEVTKYWSEMGRSKRSTAFDVSGTAAATLGPWTFSAAVKGGVSPIEGNFKLGGAFNLTGSNYGRYAGDHMAFGRLMAYRSLSSKLMEIGAPVWAGMTLEAGRAYNSMDRDRPGWKTAAGLYLGADTWIGPIYLVGGKTFGGDSAVYFMWGHIR